MRCLARILATIALVATAVAVAVPASAKPPEPQWHLESLRVAEAHRLSTGAGVTVAVIDTGVADHPDLAGQVLPGLDLSAAARKDPRFDGTGHGTAVAGIIAAKGPAPSRALGIAPGARILPIKIPTETLGVSRDDEAIRWAVDNGANVINISGGVAGAAIAGVTDAVRYALDHDVVVVASAGNLQPGAQRPAPLAVPASVPGVLGVGAHDRDGVVWPDSGQGPQLALTAPGVAIPAIYPDLRGTGTLYLTFPAGTSLAAPMVSGAVALVRSKYPNLRAADVIQRLVATADDAGAPGRDPVYGFGRLNLVRALSADVPAVKGNPLGEPRTVPSATGGDRPGSAKIAGLPRPVVYVGVGLAAAAWAGVLLVGLLVWRNRRSRRANGGVQPSRNERTQP